MPTGKYTFSVLSTKKNLYQEREDSYQLLESDCQTLGRLVGLPYRILVPIWGVVLAFFLLFFCFFPGCMSCLVGSPTRDQTRALGNETAES